MGLPDEVIVEILNYLDVRELVDFAETVPKLKYLIWHPKLWRVVDLQRIFCFSDDVINMLTTNALQVKFLVITNPNFFSHNKVKLELALTRMTNVTYLDLSLNNLIEDMSFFLHMPHLTNVMLDCLSVLTTHSLQNYLPQCTSIQTLSMKGNPFLSMFDVTAICCQLVNLRWVDTQGTCDFTPDMVEDILSSCGQMRTFLFNSFYYSKLYRQWVELVNVKFPHITFHYTTYQQVTRFERKLRHAIEI